MGSGGASLPWTVLRTHSPPPIAASAPLPPLCSPAPPPAPPCSHPRAASAWPGRGHPALRAGRGVTRWAEGFAVGSPALRPRRDLQMSGFQPFAFRLAVPLRVGGFLQCWGGPASDGHTSEPGPQPVALPRPPSPSQVSPDRCVCVNRIALGGCPRDPAPAAWWVARHRIQVRCLITGVSVAPQQEGSSRLSGSALDWA